MGLDTLNIAHELYSLRFSAFHYELWLIIVRTDTMAYLRL